MLYIEVVLEEGDPKMLSKALKNVIEAHGGVDQLSAQVKKLYNRHLQNSIFCGKRTSREVF